MERSKLSAVFSMCTLMMHDAITEYYEDLHDPKGDPITDCEEIGRLSIALKNRLLNEIQMMTDVCVEYQEER